MSEELQVRQAVRDIEVIRASGVGCEFREAEYADEEYVGEQLELVFPGARPVDLEAVYRLIKHSETPPGLDVLKKAFGRAAGRGGTTQEDFKRKVERRELEDE